MKKDQTLKTDAAELCRRAEERLKEKLSGPDAGKEIQGMGEDLQRLVQELEISRIELEIQNEELVMQTDQLLKSRAEVEEGLALYTELYDFAPVGYFTLDRDGVIRRVNFTGARLLGLERRPLTGRPFGLFVSDADRSSFIAFLKRVFAGQTKQTCELALRRQKTVPHLDSPAGSSTIDDMDQVIVSIEGIAAENALECRVVMTDISERKLAEVARLEMDERLLRAEKMEALGILAGGVAHDLNNVLGVVIAFSELLLEKVEETSPLRSYAKHIMDSSDRAAAIVEDLLTMARRGVHAEAVVNLNTAIAEYQNTPEYQKVQMLYPRIRIQTELETSLLNLQGSPIHLSKSIMNLVLNAAEAIREEGVITIKTENVYLDRPIHGYDDFREGDYAVLSVSDTGEGITADDVKRIFEPFYTKKTMGRSGTGLGLAIVWGTVKDHNGYIDVQTEVDKGTTFTLYFPVTRKELIATQPKEPIERYMGKGETVLVVDDIAEQRDVAFGLLTRLGYEVHVVSSGEDAVEYLKGNKAAILVLDMIMAPGIDGLETYERVLEVSPNQKAIIVSGFSETDRVKKAQKLGAGTYVKKPYVMEKIGVAIRDELERGK